MLENLPYCTSFIFYCYCVNSTTKSKYFMENVVAVLLVYPFGRRYVGGRKAEKFWK